MTGTIVLTGISGFIAKHVALRLLQAGHAVRGTLRGMGRADEVRAALRPHLDATLMGRLAFAEADLERDAGWAAAMAGAGAVVHTASPFPLAQPRDEGDLIRPAVEGTRRVLEAARRAGIGRVVVTSSVAAIMNGRPGILTEDDWLDPGDPRATPYERSKVLAERAAWDIAARDGLALTTINPGLVLGPPLDDRFGSSLALVQRFLKGRDPMVPRVGFPVVDVRDVAEMHLRAIERPATAGRRYIASAGSMWMADMCRVLKADHPDRRIPTREAPNLLLRGLALVDRSLAAIVPRLGLREQTSNARAVSEMGMAFVPPDEAVRASARVLVDRALV